MLGAKRVHRQTIMDSARPLLLPFLREPAGRKIHRSRAAMLKLSGAGALAQHRLYQPADPDCRREEQPEGQQRRGAWRPVPQISAHEVSAERRQCGQFNGDKDRDEVEPYPGDGGELDIAETKPVAAAPAPVAE